MEEEDGQTSFYAKRDISDGDCGTNLKDTVNCSDMIKSIAGH